MKEITALITILVILIFFFASLKKIFFSIYFKCYTINYDSKESNNIVYEEQYFKKTKCIDFLHLHVNDPRQRTIKLSAFSTIYQIYNCYLWKKNCRKFFSRIYMIFQISLNIEQFSL